MTLVWPTPFAPKSCIHFFINFSYLYFDSVAWRTYNTVHWENKLNCTPPTLPPPPPTPKHPMNDKWFVIYVNDTDKKKQSFKKFVARVNGKAKTMNKKSAKHR